MNENQNSDEEIVDGSKQSKKKFKHPTDIYPVVVFISFSVPKSIWMQLGEEVKQQGGIFILRGLPRNSFKSLASKLSILKKKGLDVPVQINSQLFKDHQINRVPTFLVKNESGFNKLSGTVSLKYALRFFEQEEKNL